jgi:hypothetical protein
MGLIHMSYINNFETLLRSLGHFWAEHPSYDVSLTVRGGWFPPLALPKGIRVKVLPFESENPVLEDMQSADLLYLPLPFGASEASFVRYSLSTKMVTYLGSGIPILYHGPADAAAARLLADNGAAHCVVLPSVAALRTFFSREPQMDTEVAAAALRLAHSRFLLSDVLERFWSPFQCVSGERGLRSVGV